MMLSKETIEEIRSRNDIVDIVGASVALKRAGSSFKGLCPFHKEKTPSFHVNPDRQSFYCFGCQRGGDVFSFLMEHDGMDFMTAAKMLADRSGVILQEEQGPARKGPNKKALHDLLSKCSAYFHRVLMQEEEAANARAYLEKRQLDPAITKDWEVGFHPARPGAFRAWAKQQKLPENQLHQVGMLAESSDNSRGGDSWYERFRGRLLFPIRDELSRVVGFSGRIMDPQSKAAKYVNTPATPVFDKSRVLFGLDKARKPIHDAGWMLLGEGQIDVIRCHASGFPQAVAPQGTSLTENHVRIIRRHTERVRITFDGDSAGIKAAVRAAGMLQAEDLSVDILTLPDGQDPDSIIRTGGADAFEELLHEAQPAILFYADAFRQAGELDDPARRTSAVKQLLEFVATSPSAVQRETMVNLLSENIQVSVGSLMSDLNRRSHRRTTSLSEQKKASPPPSTAQPEPGPAPLPAHERELLGLLLDAPGLHDLIFRFARPGLFQHETSRRIFEAASNLPEIDSDALRDELTEHSQAVSLLVSLEMESKNRTYQDFSAEEVARQLLIRLWEQALKSRRTRLRRDLQNTENEDEQEGLQTECKQITLDLGVLRQGWAAAETILSDAEVDEPENLMDEEAHAESSESPG